MYQLLSNNTGKRRQQGRKWFEEGDMHVMSGSTHVRIWPFRAPVSVARYMGTNARANILACRLCDPQAWDRRIVRMKQPAVQTSCTYWSRGVNPAPVHIAVGITNGCCGVAVAYQRPPTVGGRRKRERFPMLKGHSKLAMCGTTIGQQQDSTPADVS